MDIAERFGNSHLNANLNQTQMIAMLALPEGEEEKFIAEKKAENNPSIAEDFFFDKIQFNV